MKTGAVCTDAFTGAHRKQPKMLCRILIWIFALAYVAALTLLLFGALGLAGAERDPLSGVFLILLGLPWVLLGDRAPEALQLWVGTLAPAVNLAVLMSLCRLVNRRRRPPEH